MCASVLGSVTASLPFSFPPSFLASLLCAQRPRGSAGFLPAVLEATELLADPTAVTASGPRGNPPRAPSLWPGAGCRSPWAVPLEAEGQGSPPISESGLGAPQEVQAPLPREGRAGRSKQPYPGNHLLREQVSPLHGDGAFEVDVAGFLFPLLPVIVLASSLPSFLARCHRPPQLSGMCGSESRPTPLPPRLACSLPAVGLSGHPQPEKCGSGPASWPSHLPSTVSVLRGPWPSRLQCCPLLATCWPFPRCREVGRMGRGLVGTHCSLGSWAVLETATCPGPRPELSQRGASWLPESCPGQGLLWCRAPRGPFGVPSPM